MKVCACFLLFGIFANTQSFAYKSEINPKSVNLELKTVLEFHHEDKQSDINFLDNIQNVLTEIRTIIEKKSNIKNFRRNSRDETLTGFIQDAVKIINTYEDTALEDFVHILDAEIRQYNYRGCKFSELTENHDTKKLITGKLDSIKSRSTYVKKIKINALSDMLKYEHYDSNVKNIVDYINSLYTQAGDKFRRFLSHLEDYGKSKSSRSNTNLAKIIKNGLRSIIFDHYTNLSMNTRRYLRYQIENFWRRYKKKNPFKNSKNIINESKNLEPDSRKYQKNTNNIINQKWIKAKQSQNKNKIPKKYDLKNEKKLHKNTRKETIDKSFEIQEKETRQSSHNTDLVVQQWDKIKRQGQTGDVDSLSASFDSIELHKDQQDKTQKFVTILPDKYTQKSTNVTKKPDIIDNLNVTTKTPTHNTSQKNVLWIEQSTGRLPKAVLDKLANNTGRSNPDLTGMNLNKNGPRYKTNKDQKRWHRIVNKPDNTRRKGYEPENAKTHEKMQNRKTLGYSELMRGKTNEKIYQQVSDKTYGKIYEQAVDTTRGNINEPENDKTPGSVYESENDKMQEQKYELENDRAQGNIYDRRHKPHNITKHRKPSIVKHNYRDPFSQHDVTNTNSLISNKDEEVQQYDITKGMLRVELKHDNQPIRSTTEEFQQLLDVQMLTEPGKKHIAMGTASTRKGPAFSKPPRSQLDDIARMKSTLQTSPQSNSSIGWLHVQLPLKAYSKSNNKLYKKHDRYTKKRTEYSTSFKEGITAGNIEIIDDNRHNAQTTSFSYLKDSFERQLNQGISRANENTEEERKVKQIETMSTLDDTLRQDTSKMADTADHETDLINYVTDKDSKIKDNYVARGITLETRFRSGVNMIPVDFKVKDNLKTAETAVNKTEYSIEDHEDKYAENNIENYKKSEVGFKSGYEIPINNMVTAKSETDFKTAGMAVNKTKHTMENNYINDNDSTNNDMSKFRFRSDLIENTEVTETADNITEHKDYIINIENGKKSETNYKSNINMIPNDFNDKTDQTNTRTADIKTDFIEKENDLKNKEDIVDKDHQIYQVDDQTSIIREASNEKDHIENDTTQHYIDDITFEAKHKDIKDQNGETLTKDSEIKVITKDQKDQDFLNINNDHDTSKGTQTPTTNIASTSSSIKDTESTTKASATTVVLAALTTPKLTVPVVKFFEAPDVWQNVELNAIVNENKNKIADTLPDVDVIRKVKSKIETNSTNLYSEVTPTTL